MNTIQKSLALNPQKLRLFIGTFLCMFVLVTLQHLGFRVSTFLSPVPSKIDIFDKVLPRLEQKENTFTLIKPVQLIPQANASAPYDGAASYLVMNFDSGEVLQSKHADASVPIASLTKIMTAVVALDLLSPENKITITQKASEEIPTKIGVVPGEHMTLNELLHAMLMTSANDAAEAVRDGVDAIYGGDVFIRAMNEKATLIGLKKTHFANPQGFDASTHYSSAEDLAVLSHYALTKYPLIREIVKKEYIFLPATIDHKQFDLYNWNGLLGVYPGAEGIKIGNTELAGKTTVVAAKRGETTLLVVLLGAPGILERDMWTADLLDAGFSKLAGLPTIDVTEKDLREKYSTWKYQ